MYPKITIAVVLFLIVGMFPSPATAATEEEPAAQAPKFRLTGFSDFAFKLSDDSDPGASSGFEEGQFVLHVVSELSERFNFFAELSLSAKNTEFKAEVERVILKFTYNDYVKISMGRFHTPVNWWNNAFHHGQWLQTSISRPEMTRFGGEFIPVHFVGAIVEGNIPSGPSHLAYLAGVGNGRAAVTSRGGDAGDVNENRAVLLKLFSRPARPYRLEVGGSYYLDKITRPGLEEFDEALSSFYVVWSSETPEIIGEWARTEREGETSGERFDSTAWYLQAAYRLPFLDSMFKPYARYEKIDVADNEPVFITQTDRQGYLVGIRADISTFVALKTEFRHQRTEGNPYDDAFFAQVSFVF